MGDNTGIQWTHAPGYRGATWNPTVGCQIKSPGCAKCYAQRETARLSRMGLSKYDGLTTPTKAGPVFNGVIRLDEKSLTIPLKKIVPTMFFVNSMSDLFYESLPDEAIDRVMAIIIHSWERGHVHLVLTKRPDRMHRYFADPKTPDRIACERARIISGIRPLTIPTNCRPTIPIPNLWLGVSAERQKEFDERWPWLASTPAVIRFISWEPALGPLNIGSPAAGLLHWVIGGGESGHDARPNDVEWIQPLLEQCRDAGIAYFQKQLGAKPHLDGKPMWWIKHRKGGDPEEWPLLLRVREFPHFLNPILKRRLAS